MAFREHVPKLILKCARIFKFVKFIKFFKLSKFFKSFKFFKLFHNAAPLMDGRFWARGRAGAAHSAVMEEAASVTTTNPFSYAL